MATLAIAKSWDSGFRLGGRNDGHAKLSLRGNDGEVRGHRMEEKMGPRIREDKKWGVFTPIPAFPHDGGRSL